MPAVPFRDVVVSILSAALGPARPYTDFMAWERPSEGAPAGAQRATKAGTAHAQRPHPRPIQVWLSFVAQRSEDPGPPESVELWLVDPDLAAPDRHLIRDLPQLHRFLGMVHRAAGGQEAPEPPGPPPSRVPATIRRALLRLRGQPAQTPPPQNDPAPHSMRAKALVRLTGALGDYSETPIKGGSLYRWTISRPDGSKLYITLDSPELPNLAHIIISDPSSGAHKPIDAYSATDDEELGAIVDYVRRITAPEARAQGDPR